MTPSCSLRAVLGTALFVAAASLAAPSALAGGGPVSDDFDRTNLDQSTWTPFNPLGVGQIAMVGAGTGDAHVALSLPAGVPHDAWGTGALRLMQPSADTDFEVEAKFRFEPTAGFNDQGIVVEQDASNWLRFDVFHDGSNLKAFIGRTAGGSTSPILNATIPVGTANYIRVRRTGNLFEMETSNDGSTWTLQGSATQALTVTSTGVFAANPVAGLAFTAELDYFFETSAPIAPEDGGAPADTDSPYIHSPSETLGLGEATIEWFTDEACTGTVEYGETLSYELGSISDAGGLYEHSVLLTGLSNGVTYHYRILSDDGVNPVSQTGDFDFELDTTGPDIDVWYGLDQDFGQSGLPQPWVNVLGNVSDPDGIASLSYTLNGGTPVSLSVGPDGRRLENTGDFNVDLATVDLDPGSNTVVISAVDNASNTSVRTVNVDFSPGNVWPLPTSIDWSAATEIEDVAQVVDGKWSLEGIGVRTTEPGYDRLIGFGDTTWDDYEVLVPITMNSLSPSSGGAGVLMRWNGHTDFPIAGTQPKSGYLPLGCIGWYRNGRVELYGNGGDILDTDSRTLTTGLTYWFRMQVETISGVGATYRLRVWEDGTTEPATWDVEGQETLSDPQFGSALLISHQYDVTFGDVDVTPVIGPPNVAPTANDDLFYVTPGGSADADLLSNDVDTDGVVVPATVNVTQMPANGTLSIHPVTGVATYDHDGSATTTDEFRYTVEDNDGAVSNEAVVTVEITATPPVPFLSDDFNCGLDGSLWEFVNPLRDGTFDLVGIGTGDAWLELSLPAGSEHNAWGGGGINESARLMQDANNQDFQMLVEWKSEPVDGYNDQGIIVEDDSSNWLRFDVFHTGSVLRAFIGKTIGGSNTTVVSQNIAVGSATHARLTRSGNDFTFEVSGDGTTWSTVGVLTQSLIVRKVGVFAANPLDALAFTSEVDYVFETSEPIVPEDGNSCFAGALALSLPSCQDDADVAAGDQVVAELRVEDLTGAVDEFTGFVEYDLGVLSYRGDLSAYTGGFPTHANPILQADDGLLELDGTRTTGLTADEVVAVLVFDVVAGCDQADALGFEVGGASPSELAFGGTPVPTTLAGPGAVTLDDVAPVIGALPDLAVASEAGLGAGCDGAVVDFTPPVATDDCTAAPAVVCSPASGSVFPVGTTTVTCTAIDDCGNEAVSTFDVEVSATNVVDATIVLVDVAGPVTRCIRLATDGCVSTEVELDFFGTPATFAGPVELACGASTIISAKDPQHTLCDTATLSLSGDGLTLIADPLYLESGDTDDDGDVDINDLTWFLFQFGQLSADGGCPWDGSTRDADFGCDGAVGSEDYAYLSANWLKSTACGCALPVAQGPEEPGDRDAFRRRLSLRTDELPPAMRARLDRDGDGVFDVRDVRRFEQDHGLSGDLSRAMERSALRRRAERR